MELPEEGARADCAFDLALLSDVGTERPNNEDSCGSFLENATTGVFVVADGVGGYEGGEHASQTAVSATIKAFRESPGSWGPGKRLYRAVQAANIEIHDRALVVPELRGMATTITAVAVDRGVAYAGHVGDSRLYLKRGANVTQVTKDHTVVGERVRLGLLSKERARQHPERSTLTRSVGRDLIVAVDRITLDLMQGDVLIACSDGLYNVLNDDELSRLADGPGASDACRALIDAANARGTGDNVTCAVLHMLGRTPLSEPPRGWLDRLRRVLRQP